MKKLLVILSLAAMTNVSIASVEQITLSNPPAGTNVIHYPNRGKITSVNDLNKDGIGDFAISSAGSATGPVVVIYGSAALPQNLDLSKIQTGSLAGQGFNVSIYGCATGFLSTPQITRAADVDGDGKLDLVMLVTDGGGPVNAVVLFGTSGDLNQNIPHLTYCDGSYSYAFPDSGINGFAAASLTGTLANFDTTDFNADGKVDFLFTSTVVSSPRVMIEFGASAGTYQNQTLVPILVGTLGINSPQVLVVNASSPVSAALGDTSGDSIGDILVGTFPNGTNSVLNIYRGSSTYGQSGTGVSVPSTSDSLILLAGGTVKFVASARDFNGDSLQDTMVGNSGTTAPNGTIYIVNGKMGGVGTVTLDYLTGSNSGGFAIYGTSYPGCNAFQAVAANVNGDSFGDLVILAPRTGGASCANARSLVYIVLGKNTPTNVYLNDANSFDGYVILNDALSGSCPNSTACNYVNGGNPPSYVNVLQDFGGSGIDGIALGFGSGSTSESFIITIQRQSMGTTTTGTMASASSLVESVISILF